MLLLLAFCCCDTCKSTGYKANILFYIGPLESGIWEVLPAVQNTTALG